VLDEDGFYVKYKATGARFSECKSCWNARNSARDQRRRAEDLEGVRAQRRAWYAANREAYRARERVWNAANPDRIREKARRYREAHHEQVLERGRVYDARRAALKQTYYHRYPEQAKATIAAYRERNRERLRLKGLEDYQRNKERFRANTVLRQKRVKEAGGSFTRGEWRALCAHYGNRCLMCGARDVRLSIDHVIAVSHGGASSIDNIQPLCLPCNRRKQNRDIDFRPLWSF
jgi:5-methylcytosine-specific restriction endonuclease McrA